MFISKFFSYNFKVRVLLLWRRFFINRKFSSADRNQKKVFIFLAADYGNLGDVAITYGQKCFLIDCLKEHKLIEIPISLTIDGINYAKSVLNKNDIITTVGGGNLGELYGQIEFLRQLVVENFPDNKIVSFPQTFDFSSTEAGRLALYNAKSTYAKHKDLTFVARERLSYELMQSNFDRNKIVLSPDIVMYLDKREASVRKGLVLCLRNDSEKNLKLNDEKVLFESINKRFENVRNYDTHIDKIRISNSDRDLELSNIWKAFRNSELVITDRLHGMIFCYITQTPCLVFQNNNHKVKGCYDWIKNSSNIFLIESFDIKVIDDLLDSRFYESNKYQAITENFEFLKQALR